MAHVIDDYHSCKCATLAAFCVKPQCDMPPLPSSMVAVPSVDAVAATSAWSFVYRLCRVDINAPAAKCVVPPHAQVAFNRVSYSFPQVNAPLANCMGLLLFTLIAVALFWRHTRFYVYMWAEALAVTKQTDITTVR